MSTNETLTDKDIRLLALAWQCMDTTPKLDYEKLASISGYTVGSAKVTFRKVKAKIDRMAALDENGNPTAPPIVDNANSASSPKTPSKRGGAKADGTPASKRARAGKGKGKGAAAVGGQGENDDDEETQDQIQTPSKKGKGGRKKAAELKGEDAGMGGGSPELGMMTVKAEPKDESSSESEAEETEGETYGGTFFA